jgi:hypothetical protein
LLKSAYGGVQRTLERCLADMIVSEAELWDEALDLARRLVPKLKKIAGLKH